MSLEETGSRDRVSGRDQEGTVLSKGVGVWTHTDREKGVSLESNLQRRRLPGGTGVSVSVNSCHTGKVRMCVEF